MSSIEVTNLQKTFQTKRKAEGLGGSVRSLFKPQYSSIEAVRRLTFQMEAGELLGFIGPNGAGKSTTIKMLTGILHPVRKLSLGQRMRCEVAASLLHRPKLILLDEASIGSFRSARQ